MVKLSLVVINIEDTLHTDFNIDMTVVTMADGLEHNYFSYITWLKDNASPVGTATLVTAYIPHILRYWNAYNNVVILSAKLENNHNNTNTEENEKDIFNITRSNNAIFHACNRNAGANNNNRKFTK